MSAEMEGYRTSGRHQVLRRLKFRRSHLSRLLEVIRTFRRRNRTPAHLAVASQIRVRQASRRSMSAVLKVYINDQWHLRRSLHSQEAYRVNAVAWANQLLRLRRIVRIAPRSPVSPEISRWERTLTDHDRPLQVVAAVCGGVILVIAAMAATDALF